MRAANAFWRAFDLGKIGSTSRQVMRDQVAQIIDRETGLPEAIAALDALTNCLNPCLVEMNQDMGDPFRRKILAIQQQGREALAKLKG